MSPWLHLVVSLLGGGILLGLGLAKARAVAPAAGWLFAAAGLIIPISACCVTAPGITSVELADPEAVYMLTTVLGSSGDLLATILVAAAFVVLGRAKKKGPALDG